MMFTVLLKRIKSANRTSPSTKHTSKIAPVQKYNQRLLFNNHKSMNKNQLVKNKGLGESEELLFVFIDEIKMRTKEEI